MIGVVLVLLAALLWLNRRTAAREILVGWLDRRGVAAQVEVERLELNGFVARVRIGDPRDPDVSVERVEVDYALSAPWSRSGLGLTASRVRLVRPVLKARWRDGRLSLGSLDPILEEFTGRPPRPDSRAPVILIEGGRVWLDTEYGPVAALVDARLDNGKLMRLSARVPAAALRSGDIEARGLTAAVELTTVGDRTAVTVDAAAERFAVGETRGEAVQARITGDLPYPDLKGRRGDGRVGLSLNLRAGALALGETRLGQATADLAFAGSTTGWLEAFRIDGETRGAVGAGTLEAPGASARGAALDLNGSRVVVEKTTAGLGWRLEGPARLRLASGRAGTLAVTGAALSSTNVTAGGRGAAFEASGPVLLEAASLSADELVLRQARARLALDITHAGATAITANGAVEAGGGAWPLFGAPTRDDLPDLAEIKRALGDFSLSAPSIAFSTGSAGTRVALTRPVVVAPRNGGMLTVSAAPGRAVFEAGPNETGGGALRMAATPGRGLPRLDFDVSDWRLTPGGFEARLAGEAALDFDVARDLTLRTAGTLASDNGRLTYVTRDCAAVAIGRLAFDANAVTDVSASLCPMARPLLTVADGNWRVDGALRGLSAEARGFQLKIADGAGELAAGGGPRGLWADARITAARASDLTAPLRFNPLNASGAVALRDERWSGAFDLATGARRIAALTLAHDGRSGVGGVAFETRDLTFEAGGLQPSDLTPLTQGLVSSPAVGTVAFAGRFDWTPTGTSSGGVLDVPGLDFVSPAGPVKNLHGRVEFTSLTPLETAPGQALRADLVQAASPISDLAVTFSLGADALTVSTGDLRAAQGRVRVEPFSIPLDPSKGFGGVIVIEDVQLGDLIAGAGFQDSVGMDAVVSGRLPFTSDRENGIRITGGTLYAVQPGRLSIKREALSDLEAGGGGEVPPNTVEDLAYQAMENLAFEVLTASVNSLDEGRLGVLFHVVGRHDPPERQELRLSLSELISRDFLKRTLPLPSGTGIDLTLDTTFNANQLVSDLLAVDRARRGEAAPISEPAPAPAPAPVPLPAETPAPATP